MNSLEILSLRTNAALGRLADLQRRADQSAQPQPSIVRPALKELSSAVEVLQVANQQLHEQVTTLAELRQDTVQLTAIHEEFVNALPLACVWTDHQGILVQVNEASAMLLNVSRARLPGKPLSLFLTQRPAFFEALTTLMDGRQALIELAVRVRPRERRPRQMQLTGQRLKHDPRLCWYLRDAPGVAVGAPAGASDRPDVGEPSL